jgi:hypothetical protein
MMILSTFLTFFFALGNELEVSKVFTSMSLFEITNEAIDIQLVDAIYHTKEIQIVIGRVVHFLLLLELETNTNCNNEQQSTNGAANDDLEQILFVFKNVNIG